MQDSNEGGNGAELGALEDAGIDRRRLIKRVGAGAAIVWASPALVGIAHAQTPSDDDTTTTQPAPLFWTASMIANGSGPGVDSLPNTPTNTPSGSGAAFTSAEGSDGSATLARTGPGYIRINVITEAPILAHSFTVAGLTANEQVQTNRGTAGGTAPTRTTDGVLSTASNGTPYSEFQIRFTTLGDGGSVSLSGFSFTLA